MMCFKMAFAAWLYSHIAQCNDVGYMIDSDMSGNMCQSKNVWQKCNVTLVGEGLRAVTPKKDGGRETENNRSGNVLISNDKKYAWCKHEDPNQHEVVEDKIPCDIAIEMFWRMILLFRFVMCVLMSIQ